MAYKKSKKSIALLLSISIFTMSIVGCSSSDIEGGKTIQQESKNELSEYQNSTIQNTEYGKVEGYLDDEDKTLIWKGIPYAKAPVGDLRWKEPQDPENWTKTLDATEPKEIAIQLSGNEIKGSDDCLSLDIYRPNTDEKNLPVLVFIHGGNNQTGSSADIDGTNLAVNANAIVVSIQYRLGALGFINLPALKDGNEYENSGNFALLDINKALDWVNENIANFGGNKENITVSGFSAGGRNVMAMLISPMFEGKFQKAISFSGGMTIADYDDSEKVFAKAIAPLVVEDKVKSNEEEAYEWLLTDDKDVKEYLYNISSDRLVNLMNDAGIRMSVFPHLFNDGVVLPKEGFDTENYNDVPLIMLASSGEFSCFTIGDKYFAGTDIETLLTDENKYNEYRFAVDYGNKLYGLFNAEESAEKMINKYESPIYTCDFEYGDNEEVVGEELAKTFGSFHGVFLPFLADELIGMSAAFPEAFENDGAKDLTEKFTKYISNFLWNDDPNSEGLVKWEKWTNENDGPTQLLLDANKDEAIIQMSYERTDYKNILEEMDNDNTISQEAKNKIIKEVLNGRWFSNELDKIYGNESLWIE